ncbi:helix-turn-helix domain-containing protein [Paenibacillus sp. LHD-117]|uniref:GH39 family glycosyl hydrolase n=1 Tax=Paenibacillus sp. LHD-117 TaxID=3071412 RepID=UPI0027DEC284|nr:helix-turn-helix domain-containing protein [Paenibacillus sp. LHD-117]MDQ6422934.1 helix-turn-helix domain-containing protein [Paenibacillus sp. LHD-117]
MRNSVYEWIETTDTLPFDVQLHSVNYVPSHWHNSIEIIFVLRGELEATVNQTKYALSEGDVLLINDCHVHEVIGMGMNIIATFLIPTGYLKENLKGAETKQFRCFSGSARKEQRQALDRIRQYMAEMVYIQHKQGETFELEMRIRMLSIFSLLIKQFEAEAEDGGGAMNEKYMDRMLRIITYIDEHYSEPISLQAIAEREYLSIPYLSKFFSENIGVNFQTYITSIRLKNAVDELLRSADASIADIALKHGFPNAKSFYSAFKSRYGLTPNDYRKQYRPEANTDKGRPSSNYLAFSQSSALGIIHQYLHRGQSFQDIEVGGLDTECHAVPVTGEGTSLRHTWKQLITIGKAKEGLHADVQEQLRFVQQTSPFRYIRFHGIFDDDMMVYQENAEGEPAINFRFVDQLFDFLLSIGLKPFVELGFMPSELAADKSKTIFYRKSCVSPPKSLDKWCLLMDRFVRHCMNRYGAEEVESWRFEFWNEPELEVFWPGTREQYFEFYSRTYRTFKAISPALLIGAPGRIMSMQSEELLLAFFEFCRRESCLPDFIPLHFYPHESISVMADKERLDRWLKLEPFRILMEEFGQVSPNPDYLRDSLTKELALLKEQGFGDAEVYLTEWNSTAYHRELTNDTLYKAAYIVKNIVDNLDRIDGFGYWVLSDNIEETPASSQLYHGGLGLIAQYGIPKAAMSAYELLAKLGDRLVARGERYIVTAGRGGYQVLAFNYCHFDDLYALGDISFIDATNRYNGFKDGKTVRLRLALTGLAAGRYRMAVHEVGRKQGSSYDRWTELGAPEYVTQDDIAYLKAASRPRLRVQYRDIEGDLEYVSVLEPHGISLLELSPVY